ncbi:FGGY family carbohydrate kinase [Arthrobacter sp. NPDC080031]|uniref:FGGY-family carbohydrate kinase n=1 Tax=Arthrobacter sp. NPDC080031 TaxID=3155918 RepID=UPI00344C2A8C
MGVTLRCTLGVDIGTSSSKGVLVDPHGVILATAVRRHAVDHPQPGWAEMDAAIWWQEFCEITHELTANVPAAEVAAIGVSGMGPCVLLTHDDDRPVRPAILYGIDTRATEQIDLLSDELGEEAILALGGSAFTTQAVGPKLAWVAEHEPDAFARARRLFMPSSWLVRRLTGEYVLDHHSASQSTPLYDLRSQRWHPKAVERIAPGLLMPQLRWPGEIAGVVGAGAATATGLPAGTPVITGTIDAWAEAVSVGADRPGDLMLMYGTTMFLIAHQLEATHSPSMWTTLGTRPGVHCLAGGMATSGAITNWLRDLTAGATGEPVGFPTLLAEAAASGAGAGGLAMLPYFAGERTPILDPDARGVIAGLTLSHTRGDLYRAALEATANGVRHNVDVMREAGIRIDRVVAVGGGVEGGLWAQIVTDVTQLNQVIPTVTIGASYGGAFLAARALVAAGAASPDIDAWNPPRTVLRPGASDRTVYDHGYRRYRELYRATTSVVHDLAASQRSGDMR